MRNLLRSQMILGCVTCFSVVIGVWWRRALAFYANGASTYRVSDMGGYMEWAEERCHGVAQNISHTLHPPGASMLYSWGYCLRGKWTDAEVLLFVVSCLALPAIWFLARHFCSKPTSLIVLSIAALYPPFVGFTGAFLAELPLLLLLTVGSIVILRIARQTRSSPDDHDATNPSIGRFAWAIFGGALFGVGTVLKTQALLLLLFYSFYLLLLSRKQISLRLPLLGLMTGAMIPIAMAANRCTHLSDGKFCLVANDAAQNMLFAFSPNLAEMTFESGGWWYHFGSPSAVFHGKTEKVFLDCTPWDQKALFSKIRKNIAEDPVSVLFGMITHSYYVFGGAPVWPLFTWGTVLGYGGNIIFFAILLIPTLLSIVCFIEGDRVRLPKDCWVLIFPLLTVFATSLVSSGESRYRIPFDGFSIILGVLLWEQILGKLRERRALSAA